MQPPAGSNPARPRPTLLDVARAAGLSQATVSLALNRRPEECHLSPETRRRAIAAALQLNYRPNWRARALVKRRNFTVGFVYAREVPFLTGVNEQIVAALSDTLHGFGYHQLLVPLIGDPDHWRDVIRPDRLDGCIVLFPVPMQLSQIVAETALPMVAINLLSDLPIPRVLPDDTGGTRLLMDHLLQLGHRDIAYFYATENVHYSVSRRRDAYIAAMQDAGLGNRIRVHGEPDAGTFVARHLLRADRPTAVIAFDHALASSLLFHCWDQGLRVPQDLSVATFNNTPETAQTIPPLTTIALPGREMGTLAAELLVRRIDEKDQDPSPPSASQHWLPEQLVVRRSTAAPQG